VNTSAGTRESFFSLRARGAIIAVVVAISATFVATTIANASQNPANCSENDFILQIKQLPGPPFADGQTINYTVRTGNTDPSAPGCDISNTTVTMTTPDGVVHTLETGGVYPFTTAVNQVGPTITYTVHLADAIAGPCGNVTQCPVIVATANASGVLHDDPVQDDPWSVSKTLSGPVTSPSNLHFLCYELKRTPPPAGTVSTLDQFGPNTAVMSRVHVLCNPGSKNDEDPLAPSNPNHLTGYDSSSKGNPAQGHVVLAKNQFGDFKMTLSTLQTIDVPAAKSMTAPPPPLVPPTVDRFNCYTVKVSGGFKKIPNVKFVDEFGTLHVDLVGIRQFCAPMNLNGNEPGAETHAIHLVCYKTALSKGDNFSALPKGVFMNNEFAAMKIFPDGHVIMLCVPSTKTIVS
jgi:hypothetical protein